MKYLAALLLAVTVILTSGCAVSLQPFYTNDTIVDDIRLAGQWTNGESNWRITRTAPGHFEIAGCESGSAECKADTVAVLFRHAGVTFLDFAEKPDSIFGPAIHLHGLFVLGPSTTAAGELELTMLDPDLLAKLAQHQALDTEFADTESGTILTARPDSLQRFAFRHLNDGQIFGETVHLHRLVASE